MSSSRRRRNKWLKKPEIGWVFYNPYYDLYVLCEELILKDNHGFWGRVLLSADLKKYPIGCIIYCGTHFSTNSEYQNLKYRNDQYTNKRLKRLSRWRSSSKINKEIIDFQSDRTYYKQYEL